MEQTQVKKVKKYVPKRRTDPANDEEERKCEYVVFRVTRREKGKLEKKAKALNNQLSEYCRNIVLGFEPKDKTEAEKRFRRTVVGVATNLNQIAHFINSHGWYPKLAELIREVVDALAKSVL